MDSATQLIPEYSDTTLTFESQTKIHKTFSPLVGDISIFNEFQAPELSTSPNPQNLSTSSQVEYRKQFKQLNGHIRTLQKRTCAARQAFIVVEMTIGTMGLQEYQSDELKELWRKARGDFRTGLHDSSAIAIQARETIGDFLRHVVPYLQDQHQDLDNKLKFLRSYRETVIQGELSAKSMHELFDGTVDTIRSFKQKCSTFTDNAMGEIKSSIKVLKAELKGLSKSYDQVIQGFKSLFLSVTVDDEAPSRPEPPRSKETVTRELGEQHQRKCDVKSGSVKVAKGAGQVLVHVEEFAVVWRLIGNNVITIEERLKILAPERENQRYPAQVVYARLSDLPGIYADLMESLDSYVKALSERAETSTSNALTKIIGWMKPST